VKLLSAASGTDWVALSANPEDDETTRNAAKLHHDQFDRGLTDLLLSENLIVVCGLGTTQCILDGSNRPLAPTMASLWSAAQAKAGAQFEQIKAKVKYAPLAGETENIETLLSQCQLSHALEPAKDVEDFISEVESIIVEKCRFATDAVQLPIHEAFLRRVARRPARQPRLKLFTTNYDLCFETAASRVRFVVVDGFSHTQPQEFDGSYFNYDFVRRERDREVSEYIPNVFHLYKMHGSVEWEKKKHQIVKSPNPTRPLIIYPRYSKFESSYEQPFFEMMSRFQVSLREPNTGLVIVGCGFNDRHVTQPMFASIGSNVGLKAMIVAPDLETSTNPLVSNCVSLTKAGDSRLALVAGKFEELVPAIPDLVATTDAEIHQERFRAIRSNR
jgi:hypothetical protein